MTSSGDIYDRLREKLDAVGFGFPPSAPVAEGEQPEITVLKQLFSPEDAEMFVSLRSGYQRVEDVVATTGYDPETAAARLYDMSARGLLYRRGTDNGLEYRLIPLAHGVFEFNVNDPGLATWFGPFVEYLGMSAFMPAVTGTDSPFERTVPSKAEYVEDGILPQDDIVAMVDAMEDTFAVTDCMCRKAPHVALGTPLKHPLRTCMYTGEWARYAVENGFAEVTTRDEIKRIIRESEPAGRVVQVLNSDKPEVICSCDNEACLVLVQHRLGIPGPARALRSNYEAKQDLELCTHCVACVEPCPVDAFTLDEQTQLVSLDTEMCIGCGLCVGACPEPGAVKLFQKEQVYTPVGGAFASYDRQAAYRDADPNMITLR